MPPKPPTGRNPRRDPRRAAVIAGFAALVQAAAAQTLVPSPERPALRSTLVREASGIAVSRRDATRLWIVNDSGSSPTLHLAGTDGVDHGSIRLAGADNTDWEDLASFELDGKSWLLVADTGDNEARHRERALYLLEEPPLPPPGGRLGGSAPVHRVIRFRYTGGPRDCESVAVDVPGRKILLVSKRTDPPEIHELPLDPPKKEGVQTTTRLGFTRTEAPAGISIPFRNQPTAFDVRADGRQAAILTYHTVFVFDRKPGEPWSAVFARKPVALPPHVLAQAEALAYSRDGGEIYVLTEGRNPPLVRYRKEVKAPSQTPPSAAPPPPPRER